MNPNADVEILSRLTELRRENERLRRLQEALRESYGINFYVPHAKQDKFHSVGQTRRTVLPHR
jgi:hypothetical protein